MECGEQQPPVTHQSDVNIMLCELQSIDQSIEGVWLLLCVEFCIG